MSDDTALSSARVSTIPWSDLEARLRHALDGMAACLGNAHTAGWSDAGFKLLLAQGFARLASVPGDWVFNTDAVGASFRTGPYAGLSVVASMLTESWHTPDIRHRELFAELTWHARDLLAGVPPFADEMLHAGFQECHQRMADTLRKESHGR